MHGICVGASDPLLISPLRGAAGQATAGHFLSSALCSPLHPQPFHLCLYSCPFSLPEAPVLSLPCCQSDLTAVKIWPVLSQFRTFPWLPSTRGSIPSSCCKTHPDMAQIQKGGREGGSGERGVRPHISCQNSIIESEDLAGPNFDNLPYLKSIL